MQIEKVRIKGFRNFVDEEIVFAQQTLIIGPNDIGKTNLLYALRILLDRSLSDRDLDLEISDYNIYSVEKEVQITLYFTDVVEDCIRSSFKGHIKNNTFMLRYSKKPMSEYVIQCGYSEETLEEYTSRQYLRRLNLEYVDSNRNLVQYIKRSRQNLLFMAQEELEDNLREQDETVKQELQKKLDDINSQIDRLNYVKESLNCVNEELKGMTSNDEQMAVAFSSADTQVEELLANLEITYSAIRGKMHIGGDGRNNQVYLASWVAKQKIERSKERVTFFAVEEPEAHLHPHQQRQLSKYLASNFSEQIFITTHSAQIASEFLPDRMVCLYKTNNAVHAAQGGCCSKLKIVFDDFGYRLNAVSAELFFSNGVFLVEGPSEKIFYFAMDKILGLELDKKNINVIDVNGVGFKPYIKVCEALNIPFVMRTDNDIFKVPWTNKFHYAGVSRVMGIYKEILSRKNEKLLEYWEENESKSKWECDAAEHNEADIIRDYISQAMMKYGIYLSDVDLETDIANSFLYDSLSGFYGITDKTMLIKEMQKRKAENMLSYMEACIEKKMSFSELKGDKLLLPIYQLIDKARRNTYGK